MNQVQPLSIAGIYEVCIGVADAIPQLQYWSNLDIGSVKSENYRHPRLANYMELVQKCDRFDSITKMRITD
jgi:hypothetical protein